MVLRGAPQHPPLEGGGRRRGPRHPPSRPPSAAARPAEPMAARSRPPFYGGPAGPAPPRRRHGDRAARTCATAAPHARPHPGPSTADPRSGSRRRLPRGLSVTPGRLLGKAAARHRVSRSPGTARGSRRAQAQPRIAGARYLLSTGRAGSTDPLGGGKGQFPVTPSRRAACAAQLGMGCGSVLDLAALCPPCVPRPGEACTRSP